MRERASEAGLEIALCSTFQQQEPTPTTPYAGYDEQGKETWSKRHCRDGASCR